jgi:hypothetical protein
MPCPAVTLPMPSSRAPQRLPAVPTPADLDAAVGAVEQRLAALAGSLRLRDPQATEADAVSLQHALAQAIDDFVAASREGGVPWPLRQRLARAGAQVALQREALARATAALDRAIDALMPDAAPRTLYSAQGLPQAPSPGGSMTA